jgi:hypothetical protein
MKSNKEFLLMFLDAATCNWDEVWNQIPISQQQEVASLATSVAILCAQADEYANFRGVAGCGDHGHDKAIKEANKKAKKIRKAIGFSYP